MRRVPLAVAVAQLLFAVGAFAQDKSAKEEAAVTSVLKSYAAAVEAKDLKQVEQYVVTTADFTMFEGGHVNRGWDDYRDNHLGPELKQFKTIEYVFSDIKPSVGTSLAYATFKYTIAVNMENRSISAKGLATAVLVKGTDGWRIVHMHTSRIPERK